MISLARDNGPRYRGVGLVSLWHVHKLYRTQELTYHDGGSDNRGDCQWLAFCAPLMPSIVISRIEPRTCQYPGLAEALFVQGQFAWELHLRDLCRNAISSLSGY